MRRRIFEGGLNSGRNCHTVQMVYETSRAYTTLKRLASQQRPAERKAYVAGEADADENKND